MWYVLYLQVSALKISLQHFKIYTVPSFKSHSTFIICVSAHSFFWSWSKLLLGFSIYVIHFWFWLNDFALMPPFCTVLFLLVILMFVSDMFFPSKRFSRCKFASSKSRYLLPFICPFQYILICFWFLGMNLFLKLRVLF